ncbi:TIR domain-containing protein [Marinicella sp. W31]|uniref:toll/interleukin-1 receptor domain-containing protein n=1 Tax=Marinicella sp. W31 TaxID=3023713 RepID=UPI003757647F
MTPEILILESAKNRIIIVPNNKTYYAYISYRHADNKEPGRQWASWLQQAIETYEVPVDLIGKKNVRGEVIPARIYPIFRDEEELPADPDLDNSIVLALESTQFLIVLCSPNAVASNYVAYEIEYFKKLGHSDRIIAAILYGEPNASWDQGKLKNCYESEDECFPTPLQYDYDEKGNPTKKRAELIAADFRINNEGVTEQAWTSPKAYKKHLNNSTNLTEKEIQEKVNSYQKQQYLMLLKIIAGILGLPLSELTQRDKQYQLELEKQKAKKRKKWLGIIFLLIVLASIAGVFAYFQQQEARLQRIKAIEKELQANKSKQEAEKQLIETNHNFGMTLIERAKTAIQEKKYNESAYFSAKAHLNLKPKQAKHIANGMWYESMLHPQIIWSSNTVNNKNTLLKSRSILDVAISNNGVYFATAHEDGSLEVWNIASGLKMHTISAHDKQINSIAFTNNNKHLVSGSDDSTIKIWHVEDGELSNSINAHYSVVTSISVSPNGKTLASSSEDGSVQLWDTETWEFIDVIPKNTDPVSMISFSSDGSKLAVATDFGMVLIWDFNQNDILFTIKDFYDVSSMVFLLDGESLVIGDGEELKIFNLKTKKVIGKLTGHKEKINSLALSPNGKHIVSTSFDQTNKIWDLENQQLIQSIPAGYASMSDMVYSPDGLLLISGRVDENINIYKKDTSNKFVLKNGHNESINNVVFSHDSMLIASTDLGRNIKIWNVSNGELIANLIGHKGQITGIEFSPNNSQIATSSKDKTIKIWSYENRKIISEIKNDLEIEALSYSPDGLSIAFVDEKKIEIRNIESNDIESTLIGHDDIVAIKFLNEGTNLVSGSMDSKIQFWDLETNSLEYELSDPDIRGLISSIDVSSDNNYIASTDDKSIHIWDLEKQKIVTTFRGHTDLVTSVKFSNNDSSVVTSSLDKTIRIWDLTQGKLKSILTGHADSVNSISVSPNNSTLASASSDKTLKIWDLLTGIDELQLATEKSFFPEINFSSDGLMVASHNQDNSLQLWDIATKSIVSILKGHKDKIIKYKFSQDNEKIATLSDDKTIKTWEIKSGLLIQTFNLSNMVEEDFSRRLVDFTFTKSNELIVAIAIEKLIQIWDVDRNQLISTTPENESNIRKVKFSPNNSMLGFNSFNEKLVKVWDVRNHKIIAELGEDNEEVTNFVFSNDSQRLIIGGGHLENSLEYWDLHTQKKISSTLPIGASYYNLELSSNDEILASSHTSWGELVLWNVSDFLNNQTYYFHQTDGVSRFKFSPDGKYFAYSKFRKLIFLDLKKYFRLEDSEFSNNWIKAQQASSSIEMINSQIIHKSPIENLYGNTQSPVWSNKHPHHWINMANNGDTEAMYQLGLIYHKNQDLTNSKLWYEKAVDSGHALAKKRLSNIAKVKK